MKYRQSYNFIMKNVSGDDVLMARGRTALKVNGVFVFNETCSFLWTSLDEPKTIEELSELFQKKYGIDEKTATFDIKVCMNEMLKNEMIEEVKDTEE